MKSDYKEYETYIRLLYRGLACNSYQPKYYTRLIRGTKLDLSEINYLKSISKTDTIIFNKDFLSFSINKNEEKSSIIYKEKSSIVYKEDKSSIGDKEEKSLIIDKEENSPILEIKKISPILDKKENSPIFHKEEYLPTVYKEKEEEENLDTFKIAIAFQSNCERKDEDKNKDINKEPKKDSCYIANPPKKKSSENESKINFDENKGEDKNLNVLIQINNISENDKNEYIVSNAYLKDISFFSEEEEVLVFPFTGFEVTGWKNYSFSKENIKYKGTIFYFKFSKKYKELIKEIYD